MLILVLPAACDVSVVISPPPAVCFLPASQGSHTHSFFTPLDRQFALMSCTSPQSVCQLFSAARKLFYFFFLLMKAGRLISSCPVLCCCFFNLSEICAKMFFRMNYMRSLIYVIFVKILALLNFKQFKDNIFDVFPHPGH